MTDGGLRRPSVRTFARKAGRVASAVMTVLLISLLGLVGVLLLMSPGTPKPFLDERLRADVLTGSKGLADPE
mgnify:CR=1 FL=1